MERAQDRLPLQDATKQIRLLKLALQLDEELGREQAIRCTLTVHNLADVANQYIAVSYTWASKNDTKTIIVNGHQHQVRVNCWHALKQMQIHSNGYYCFIDSICIDQENHREKGEQVGQMGAIYSQAMFVAACLGPTGPEQESYKHYFGSYLLSKGSRYTHLQLQHISERQYFTRIWTIQECTLAQKVHLFFGESRVDSDILGNTLKRYGPSRTDIASISRLAAFADDCGWPKEGPGSGPPRKRRSPLQPAIAIVRYAFRECEDPRDKMFGLHPLLTSTAQRRILIDYDKPLWDILWDYISVQDSLVGARETRDLAPGLGYKVTSNVVGDLGEFMLSIRILARQFALSSSAFQTALRKFWVAQERKRQGVQNVCSHKELDLTASLANFYTKGESKGFTSSEISNNDADITVSVQPIQYHRIKISHDTFDVLIDCEQSEKLEEIGLYPSPMPYLKSNSHKRNRINHNTCRCCLRMESGAFTYQSVVSLGSQKSYEEERGFSRLTSCSSPHQLLAVRSGNNPRGMVFQVPNGTRDGDILLSIGSSPPTIASPSGQPDFSTPSRHFVVCRKIPTRQAYKTLGPAFHQTVPSIVPTDGAGLWTYGLQRKAVISREDLLELSLSTPGTIFSANTSDKDETSYSVKIAALSMPVDNQFPQVINELEQHVAHFIACDTHRQRREMPSYRNGCWDQDEEDHENEEYENEDHENEDHEDGNHDEDHEDKGQDEDYEDDDHDQEDEEEAQQEREKNLKELR